MYEIGEYTREARRNLRILNSFYETIYEKYLQMSYTPKSFLIGIGMILSCYITLPIVFLEPLPETVGRSVFRRSRR